MNLCVNSKVSDLPHILSGASSSSNIGCDKNISRDFKHNPRISDSVSCTFFPRTKRNENGGEKSRKNLARRKKRLIIEIKYKKYIIWMNLK